MPRPRFSLLKRLERQAPLLCDGAVAPLLSETLGETLLPACAANLSRLDEVRGHHRAYLHAGAQVLRTNTAGAQRLALRGYGLEDRVEAINNSGMALLRDAGGLGTVALGLIAPLVSAESNSTSDWEQAFSEQAIYLSDTGADLLGFQGFAQLELATLALRQARRVSQAERLVIWSVSQGESAAPLEELLGELRSRGADFVGIQASWDFPHLAHWVERWVESQGIFGLWLDDPNTVAGQPSLGFQETARSLLELEVAWLGGGEGTTPAHVAVLSALVRNQGNIQS